MPTVIGRSPFYADMAVAASFDLRLPSDDSRCDGGRRGAYLDEYLLEMLVHGTGADVHDLACITVGFALRDPEKDIAFARREVQRLLERRGALDAAVMLLDDPRHLGCDERRAPRPQPVEQGSGERRRPARARRSGRRQQGSGRVTPPA